MPKMYNKDADIVTTRLHVKNENESYTPCPRKLQPSYTDSSEKHNGFNLTLSSHDPLRSL